MRYPIHLIWYKMVQYHKSKGVTLSIYLARSYYRNLIGDVSGDKPFTGSGLGISMRLKQIWDRYFYRMVIIQINGTSWNVT